MDLLATLRRSGGIDALARQVGLPPAATLAGAEALLPGLLEGLRGYAQRMGGADKGLMAMLAVIDGLGDGDLAIKVLGPGPLSADLGDKVIAQFFGSADAKHRLAIYAGAASNEDPVMLERILPFLAMLVSGYISARSSADLRGPESIGWLRDLLVLPKSDTGESHAGSSGGN